MSDNWIIAIPEDPGFRPAAESVERVRQWFRLLAPLAEAIEVVTSETTQFFDSGTNFERVFCPSCGSQISNGWWARTMEADFDDGFKLMEYAVPCCGAAHTLHSLRCEWAQGFGRFAVSVMNPGLGALAADRQAELEQLLGAPVRLIYQHI